MGIKDFKGVISEVKHAYSILDFIEGYGIRLQPAGVSKYKGLCPFHSEKTPSFVIDVRFQSYNCFGCGAHGDVISFMQNTDNVSFLDALCELAERKGISVDREDSDEDAVDYVSLKKCVRDAALFYAREFIRVSKDPNHPAVREITDRGLSVSEGGRAVYGYAPDRWDALRTYLRSCGYSDELMLQAGLVREGANGGFYDFFRSRLVFFVNDNYSNPVGFSARKIFEDDKVVGKYINSPDTPIFHKKSLLYNFSAAVKRAREERTIFVAEGQFDVRACVQSGVENVVASSGTAFTGFHASLCRRSVGDDGRVVFCFDGDEAGVKAALKVFSSIPSIHTQAYAVAMPAGVDPCDFRRLHGGDGLREYLYGHIVPLSQFVLDSLQRSSDLSTDIDRARFAEEGLRVVSSVTSRPLRESLLRQIALYSGTSLRVVEQMFESGDFRSGVGGVSVDDGVIVDRAAGEDRGYDSEGEFREFVRCFGGRNDVSAALRAMHLAIVRPELIPRLRELGLSEDYGLLFRSVNELVCAYESCGDGWVFVPEDYSNSSFMSSVAGLKFFSFADDASNASLVSHFDYLVSYFCSKRVERGVRERASSIAVDIKDSDYNDIGVLRTAVRAFSRGV